MRRLLVPGVYMADTRWTDTRMAVSWLLMEAAVVVLLAVGAAVATAPVDVAELGGIALALLLAAVAWHSVYDLGYMFNDVVTVAWEREPTTRLDPRAKARLERALPALTAAKLLLAAVVVLVLAALDRGTTLELQVGAFAAGLAVLTVVFALHDLVRSRLNVVTFPLLLTAKFASVPLLFTPPDRIVELVLVTALILPLLRGFEYAALPRYDHRWLAGLLRHEREVRVGYHLVVAVLLTLWWWTGGGAIVGVGAVVSGYLWICRVIVLFALPSRAGAGRDVGGAQR